MQTVNEPYLKDPAIRPSSDVISDALKEANNTYMKFVSELENHDIHMDWRYYTDGKAWLAKGLHHWIGVRGGQKETTIFWLSIWDGFFKVTFFIPEKVRANALALPLDNVVKQMITDSKKMGKLKFFPVVFDVCSDERFEDIFSLVDFKKNYK
ncbi:MAG: hypothetical protein CVU85_03615 [Firmicutes bacterium HGW-Firmicutes-10]|jgi:hypothetical protein|nr:MAG: hypothetical protein CVU85_03615 [Firmicutes bacterium HGW-Firmicutes-10]